MLHGRLLASGARWAFRHFPVRSKHPRAWAAACAAEAAALQGAFEPMHLSLFGDQARLEDPHLWERAERLGLDLARFDADRRSDAVVARVRRDFESGIRAGVVTTPTASSTARRERARRSLRAATRDLQRDRYDDGFGYRKDSRCTPPTDGRSSKGDIYV